jgi:hypothetical protein
VSSDVIYDPDNSDAGLAGGIYTIIEGNGDVGGFKLTPPPPILASGMGVSTPIGQMRTGQ